MNDPLGKLTRKNENTAVNEKSSQPIPEYRRTIQCTEQEGCRNMEKWTLTLNECEDSAETGNRATRTHNRSGH